MTILASFPAVTESRKERLRCVNNFSKVSASLPENTALISSDKITGGNTLLAKSIVIMSLLHA